MFDIEEELKKLPARPGVYIMHGENDEVIYVGKAISLRNRVRQYFQSSRNKGVKIERMVTHIRRFEYIVTDSEMEALILECNLIKEHRPKYNTMLMDDKSYPYIKVTLGETYPRVLFSHRIKKDNSKYFGPYTNSGAVRDTLELIRKIYKLRTCNRNLPKDTGKERPCLNYHIHQCNAPCQGNISPEEYMQAVEKAMELLNGNYGSVIEMLKSQMMVHSERLEFEKAGEFKELISSVRKVAEKQKITNGDGEDRDVIALARESEDTVVSVFFIRNGKLIGRDHFFLNTAEGDEEKQVLSDFVKQFYSGTPFIPKEIMLQYSIEDEELVESWLSSRRGSRVHFLVPKKGTKEKLVELAYENASMVLTKDKERLKREEGRTIGAAKDLAGLLGIPDAYRIEAYDISNISGTDSVGSMIVYEKGKPLKNDYRKFKIRYVTGPDDYASMEEVLTRRFSHGIAEREENLSEGLDETEGSFTRFPSLIMMDGGKGQVNIALKVLEEMGLDIPVCGMVKDDNHNTRGLYYNNRELPIDRHSECFKLITRIQDEAHRFAIEYHRKLRSKGQVRSILDDIEGIGPARRKALLRAFTSVENIKEAGIEELKAVDTMNEAAAISVYEFFHKNEG
ncbi:MAG: excinuclease ABC subunit UvrC [Lachnospiraceae bacterium]|nr:excinuclease ABC subunit UvrC [Lachnospiraceae bacterium]